MDKLNENDKLTHNITIEDKIMNELNDLESLTENTRYIQTITDKETLIYNTPEYDTSN